MKVIGLTNSSFARKYFQALQKPEPGIYQLN